MSANLRSMQHVGWLSLVILAPLWVNLWGQQPFDFSKVMLVRSLVWLLAGLALAERVLVGHVVAGQVVAGRGLRPSRRIYGVLGPALLLALVMGVTTITAVNWRLSLWGSYERSQGAVTLVTYLLLFLLAAGQFRRVSQARQVITAMALTGVPVVLLGLLQVTGWNPFGLVTDARSPFYATLGRANFAGAYLSMLAPLTLAQLLTARTSRRRVLWSLLLLGELAGIGLAQARSAGLAVLLSLALVALLWWGPQWPRRWQWPAWGLVGMLFLSGPLAVFVLGQQDLGSTAARLAIWEGVLRLIIDRPLLGYGTDSLGLIFPAVYAPELVYLQGREVFVDRAHNLLLDWTISAGIPGLLAYLLVLGTFVRVIGGALRARRSAETRALLMGVLAAVLGNIANNLTSFDVAPTATAGWLLMGMGVALASPPKPPEFDNEETSGIPFTRRWVAAGLLLTLIGVAIWQMNIRPVMGDVAARRAAIYAERSEWSRAVSASEQAISHWPEEPAHHLRASRYHWQQALEAPAEAATALGQAEAALHRARVLRPDDAGIWLQTAEFYAAAARETGYDTWDRAQQAYSRTATLAPNHATVYTAWGRDALALGDLEAAAAALRQAVTLDASNGNAYVYLGAVELALGRPVIALRDYQEAVRLLPASGAAHAGLARTYWQLGRAQEALQAVEQALALAPENEAAQKLLQDITQSDRD